MHRCGCSGLCLFGGCSLGSRCGFFGHRSCRSGGVGLFLGLHRLLSRLSGGSLSRSLLGQLFDLQLGDFLRLLGLGGFFLAGLADAGEALGDVLDRKSVV